MPRSHENILTQTLLVSNMNKILVVLLLFSGRNCLGLTKTRNSQPGCAIILNEFSHASTLGSFVEVAKVCRPGLEAKKASKLGGYLLLIVETHTLRLKFMENLHRRDLTMIPYNKEEDEDVAVKLRHSKHSKSYACY